MEEKKNKPRGRGASKPYPIHTLKKSLTIIEAMEKNFAGDPTDPIDIADVLDSSLNSSDFRSLLVSSHRYGLITGTYKSPKINMTELGKSIVEFTSEDEKNKGLLESFVMPKTFKKILEKYDRKTWPNKEILRNVLKRESDVAEEQLDECVKILTQNVLDFKLIHEKTKILRLSKLSTTSDFEEGENLDEDSEDKETSNESNVTPEPEISEPAITKEVQIPTVFITHSKNKKILEHLKQMLQFGGFEYKIAVEESTTSIPVPEKVFGLMQQCNCAIINVSADEEKKQSDDSYQINENVLIEIGGAYVHYDKRVILLVDKRLKLPSNLQGLYVFRYEGDEFSWEVGMELQKALSAFKKPFSQK